MGPPRSLSSPPAQILPPPPDATPLLRARRAAPSPPRASQSPSSAPPPPLPPRRRRSLIAKLGQSFNPAGIALFARIALGGRGSAPLLLPHVAVSSVDAVDWAALAAAGFAGAVFDKDNTLTEPYARTLTPAGAAAVAGAAAAFGASRIALLSNSAGLAQYDPDGAEADELEAALGVAVIRHASKKPAGGADALASFFGVPPSRLVMVGDRYLTDIVYGNRHGMLTVRPAPVTAAGEPRAVRVARRVEDLLVARARRKGVVAPVHAACVGGVERFVVGEGKR